MTLDSTTDAKFTAVANEYPARVALIDDQGRMTYRRLAELSDDLAVDLRERGIGQDVPVAVRMPRSAAYIATILGIWKAGGTCVPIDPILPEDQGQALLRSIGAALLVDGTTEVQQLAEPAPAGPIAPGQRTAYIFFTSGSTGRPKGVAVPHLGIRNEAEWSRRAFALTPQDRGTWLSSPAFAISRWELWPHLTTGASVAIASQGVEWSAEEVQRWLHACGASTTILVTSLGERVMNLPWPPTTNLRLMVLGGERLRRWPNDVPFTVVNSYGATETSGARLTATLPTTGTGFPPIGTPIGNTDAHVLDSHGAPVRPGEVGELYIGGVGLAHGYVGRPALTAERFVADPFRGGGTRMYRTGDLVWQGQDEILHYHGRIGADPKVAGGRVDLAEVESALLEHPRVTGAAATVVELNETATVVAYINLQGTLVLTPHELRTFLTGRLPRHAVPIRFFRLDHLPTLISGKLDRARLPDPDRAEELREARVAPRTELEEQVHQAFRTVLPDREVGVFDDFFALGGDSLALSRLRAECGARLGVDLRFTDLYARRSVAEVAELVAGTAAQQPSSPMVDTGPIPLSAVQRSLWLHEHDDPTGLRYVETVTITLRGELNHTALRTAFADLVAGQELLRARFAKREPEPVLLISPAESAPPLVPVDTAPMDGAAPIDRADGPLYRVWLQRVADDSHVLTFAVHHLIWDGASAEILLAQLMAGYEGRRQGQGNYRAYVARERRALTADRVAGAVEFWRGELADSPASSPAFARAVGRAGDTLGVLDWTLPESLVADLRRVASAARCTLVCVGAVAFAAALEQHGGGAAPVLLTPVSLRGSDDQDTIGLHLSMLPLPVRLAEGRSGRAVLSATAAGFQAGLGHADTPFAEVVRELRPARSRGETPYGQFLFEVNRLPSPATTADGVTWDFAWSPSRSAKFRLLMSWNERVCEDGHSWTGRLEYDTVFVTPGEAARFVQDVEAAARRLAEDPDGEFAPDAASTPTTRGAGPADAGLPAVPPGLREFLAETWKSVLDIEDVADGDGFMELGGHSLAAMQVVIAVEGAHGVQLPIQTIFDAHTFAHFVADVAVRIESETEDDAPDA